MSLFEDIMSLAVQLPRDERERLGKALGLKIEAPKNLFPMAKAPDLSVTDPAAWKARERGHAVLNTPHVQGATGADAIRGMWSHIELPDTAADSEWAETVSQLLPGTPVVVHSSVALDLALGGEATRTFWATLPVEVRLATPTYLSLLEGCEDEGQRQRVHEFVAPFAVLSLGPMASNRAVQLMLTGDGELSALDALIAATALAHEIPLVTLTPEIFQNVAGLEVVVLA
ncbi:PIN domain-containing protein [bacterium]|nr:MAG: PIN domain-containing protein [bacterium]